MRRALPFDDGLEVRGDSSVACSSASVCLTWGTGGTGWLRVAVVPTSGALVTLNHPPFACIRSRTLNSPKCEPAGFDSGAAGLNPRPWSCTSMRRRLESSTSRVTVAQLLPASYATLSSNSRTD